MKQHFGKTTRALIEAVQTGRMPTTVKSALATTPAHLCNVVQYSDTFTKVHSIYDSGPVQGEASQVQKS